MTSPEFWLSLRAKQHMFATRDRNSAMHTGHQGRATRAEGTTGALKRCGRQLNQLLVCCDRVLYAKKRVLCLRVVSAKTDGSGIDER